MPIKHQPDLMYLRQVPLKRIHIFTFIQLFCLAVLWAIKSTPAALIFPVMVSLCTILQSSLFNFQTRDSDQRKNSQKNPISLCKILLIREHHVNVLPERVYFSGNTAGFQSQIQKVRVTKLTHSPGRAQ